MKRYNAVYRGVYDNSVMVEERDGDWVWWEDVESLRKIQRYLFVSHSNGVKHMFGELVPCEPCEAALCMADDVVKLEVSHAQLLEALQDAIALYGKFGAIVNDPHNAGEWITKAQEAVRRATE